MELDLYNTYVHIRIKEYEQLKELAEISEEKILQRAKELQDFEEKQDKYSKLIYIRAGDDDFMLRVSTYCDFDEQLQPIASKLQWWIEEQIYERYKSDDPFETLKRKINEEQEEKLRYMRSSFLSWILTIVMVGILISFLIFKLVNGQEVPGIFIQKGDDFFKRKIETLYYKDKILAMKKI